MQDFSGKNTREQRLVFNRILTNLYSPVVIIVSVALLVHLPNLLNYLAWFFDEGAYLTFSNQWLMSQNHPAITAYDRYSVPWAQLTNQTVYLIVDYPGDLVTINNIPEYQELYAASLSTARNFMDPASVYIVQVLYGVVASS